MVLEGAREWICPGDGHGPGFAAPDAVHSRATRHARRLQLTLREGVRCVAMADLKRTWKVGELAQATGLTIRALAVDGDALRADVRTALNA